MNGTYFKNPNFSENTENNFDIARDSDKIKNLLKLNIGKKAKIYITIDDSNEWRDKTFSGIIEEANEEFIILSEPSTGNWYILPEKFIAYIEFEEKINF